MSAGRRPADTASLDHSLDGIPIFSQKGCLLSDEVLLGLREDVAAICQGYPYPLYFRHALLV
jgi:hypothetical protein